MRTRIAIGVALIVVGGVWFGQGIGTIKGSFMTGEPIWAVIGAIAVIFGLALLVAANRIRGSDGD
jgi:hypothetical protein